jgi:hypothetical protein
MSNVIEETQPTLITPVEEEIKNFPDVPKAPKGLTQYMFEPWDKNNIDDEITIVEGIVWDRKYRKRDNGEYVIFLIPHKHASYNTYHVITNGEADNNRVIKEIGKDSKAVERGQYQKGSDGLWESIKLE